MEKFVKNAEHKVDIESLLKLYEKQIFDLRQLLEISKSLNSTLDFDHLIESILYICMGQMKVLRAGLFTRRNLDDPDFYLHRNYHGFELNHNISFKIPQTHELLGFLGLKDSALSINEISAAIGKYDDLEPLFSMNPSIIAPLKAKGIVNGFIILGERIDGQPFEELEKEYLMNICVLAGIAVHNSFLFEMTTTDMMTKLKLKHFFMSELLEIMENSAINGTPLSIIMIDIDYFKRLNDTYGHVCGDSVLKQVAKQIMENIRQVDIAARYGGEEFIVLLPEATAETAFAVAERVRRSVEGFVTKTQGHELEVTVSIGVAEFDSGRDIDQNSFVARADRALYVSKEQGRNRTTMG